MRIFGFNDGSACGYYRIRLPFEQLAAHGHQARTEVGADDTGPDGTEDVIVGERFDNPGILPSWRRWKATARLVYEIDDDVFAVDPVNWLAYRVFRHELPRDVAAHAAQIADLVTVTTPTLAEVMALQTGHGRVVVLPNYIDERLLELERPRRERVTVGWRGGVSHGADVAMVARPLRRFLQRNPRIDLHLVGTDFRPTIGGRHPGRLDQRVRWTDWCDGIWDYYRQVDFDVAVVPLHPTPFAASKSHIPVLEMAALGIPVIASDSHAYRDFVLDGVTGFLVRAEHEWGRRLYQLCSDPQMRAEMGAKAREHARAWTIQRNWQRWEAAYQALL